MCYHYYLSILIFNSFLFQYIELQFTELNFYNLESCDRNWNSYIEIKQSNNYLGDNLCGQIDQIPAEERIRR